MGSKAPSAGENRTLRAAALACVFALYLGFLALDLRGRYDLSLPVKYAAMVLLAVCAVLRVRPGARERQLTAAALSLTLIADWFLLVRGDHLALGVAVFLLVQLCYIGRLSVSAAAAGRSRAPRTIPVLRTLVPAALAILLFATKSASPLTLLAAVYFPQLVLSAVQATVQRNKLFALGLWLFTCCDLCVGLSNLPAPVPEALQGPVAFLMWFFYLPSQALIVFSAPGNNEKK